MIAARTRTILAVAVVASCLLVGAYRTVRAQGRGGAEWTTTGGDAQRTSSVRSDPRISVASVQKAAEGFGPFKFLWKLKVDHDPRPVNPLTQPVLLDRIVGFRGFKSIAFVGTSSGTVYAIDTDFGTELWKVHLNYGASLPPLTTDTPTCPGGLTAAVTRPTALSQSTFAGGGGFGRGGRSGGGVGEAGRGAPSIYTAGQGRGGGPPLAAGGPGLPPTTGTAVPGSAAAATQAGRAGGGGGGRGQMPGAPDAAYVIGVDGYVRALNIQSGWELFPPIQFLPANTRPAGPIVVNDDTTGFLYVVTTQGCGYTPDGVWALDLLSPKKEVLRWEARGATIAGSMGPAFGRDGTIYVATRDGSSPLSNSIVALEPKTLQQKGIFTEAKAGFVSSPIVFQHKNKDLVAALGSDGRIYILDAGLPKTPLTITAPYATGEPAGGLASWQDAEGTRWVLAPTSGASRTEATFSLINGAVTNGAIAAFKLIEEGTALTLQRAWISRDIPTAVTPMVINGVVFALSSGESADPDPRATPPRGQRSAPAVLYALDASNGKELWNSGKTITTSARAGLAGGAGVVYVPTHDSTLYAFGFPIER